MPGMLPMALQKKKKVANEYGKGRANESHRTELNVIRRSDF